MRPVIIALIEKYGDPLSIKLLHHTVYIKLYIKTEGQLENTNVLPVTKKLLIILF